MKHSKPKVLTNKGKSPLLKLGSSASRKLAVPGAKRGYKKNPIPETTFAIPGFGNTGLTGRS